MNARFFFQNYIIGAFKPACSIAVSFGDGKSRKQVLLDLISITVVYLRKLRRKIET